MISQRIISVSVEDWHRTVYSTQVNGDPIKRGNNLSKIKNLKEAVCVLELLKISRCVRRFCNSHDFKTQKKKRQQFLIVENTFGVLKKKKKYERKNINNRRLSIAMVQRGSKLRTSNFRSNYGHLNRQNENRVGRSEIERKNRDWSFLY